MAEAERLRSKHKKDFPDYKYQPRRRKPMKSLGQSQQQQQQQSSGSSSSEAKSESSETSTRTRSSRSSYSSSFATRTAAYAGGQCPPTPPATPSAGPKTRSYGHANEGRSRSSKHSPDSGNHTQSDSAFSKTSASNTSNHGHSIKYNMDSASGSVLNSASHPPALEAYMHHIVGLSPHASHNVPAPHPSAQYSHFVTPQAPVQAQGPTHWSRSFDGHHYLEPPVSGASMMAKDSSLQDLYRDYSSSSVRHSGAGVQTSASSFMDTSTQSSILAGMSVFSHDPFAVPDNRSSSDGQTSCVYGNPHSHAPLGHHFLTPR